MTPPTLATPSKSTESTAPARLAASIEASSQRRHGVRPALLDVQREDIRFGNLEPGRVWLEVEVHNRGGSASEPEPMLVRVAPFGAFVASKPVAVLAVPSIVPGSSAVVRMTFQEECGGELTPLDGDRWVGMSGDPRQHRALASDRPQAETYRPARALRTDPEPSPMGLGARILDRLFGRLLTRVLGHALGVPGGVAFRWAGNFDVHIGSAEAERHLSLDHELVAGELNVADFSVGEDVEDFVLDLQGGAASWGAGLFLGGQVLPLGKPQALQPGSVVLLKVTPPAGTTEGLLAVGVTRQATGQRALVEFGFGTGTIPHGCFRD